MAIINFVIPFQPPSCIKYRSAIRTDRFARNKPKPHPQFFLAQNTILLLFHFSASRLFINTNICLYFFLYYTSIAYLSSTIFNKKIRVLKFHKNSDFFLSARLDNYFFTLKRLITFLTMQRIYPTPFGVGQICFLLEKNPYCTEKNIFKT